MTLSPCLCFARLHQSVCLGAPNEFNSVRRAACLRRKRTQQTSLALLSSKEASTDEISRKSAPSELADGPTASLAATLA